MVFESIMGAGFVFMGSLFGLFVGILSLIFAKDRKSLKIFGWILSVLFGLLVLFFIFMMIIGPM